MVWFSSSLSSNVFKFDFQVIQMQLQFKFQEIIFWERPENLIIMFLQRYEIPNSLNHFWMYKLEKLIWLDASLFLAYKSLEVMAWRKVEKLSSWMLGDSRLGVAFI